MGDTELQASTLPVNMELTRLFRCARCGISYSPSKSTSSLRLTYCSFFCGLGDLGFSMSGLEHMQLRPRQENAEPPSPVGARD